MPFERLFGERGLRLVAAASLAVVGLVLLGLPLTPAAAWGLLGLVAAGTSLSHVLARSRRARGEVSR